MTVDPLLAVCGVRRQPLGVFIGVQLLCLAGSAVLLGMGKYTLAAGVLLLPLQTAVLVWLTGGSSRVLVYFSFFLPLIGFEMVPDYYRELFVFASSAALLGVFTVTEPANLSGSRKAFRPAVALAVALMITGASALLLGRGSASVAKSTLWFGYGLVMAYGFGNFARSLQLARRTMYLTIFSCALGCLLFLVGGMGGGGKVVAMPFARLYGNAAGALVAPVTGLVIGAILDANDGRTRSFLILAALLFVATLIRTMSRGAWLGVGAGFLYVMLRTRSFKLLLATLLLGAAVLSLGVFRESIGGRLEATSLQDASLSGRLLLWHFGLQTAKANWLLGIGLENFRQMKFSFGFPRVLDALEWYNTHSLYLELLVGTGIIGLGSFVWFLVTTFRRADLIVRRSVVSGSKLALGLNAGLIAFAIHGLMDSFTYRPAPLILLGMIAGWAVALSSLPHRECEEPPASGGERGRVS